MAVAVGGGPACCACGAEVGDPVGACLFSAQVAGAGGGAGVKRRGERGQPDGAEKAVVWEERLVADGRFRAGLWLSNRPHCRLFSGRLLWKSAGEAKGHSSTEMCWRWLVLFSVCDGEGV